MGLMFHADTLNGLIWNRPSALVAASQNPRHMPPCFVPGGLAAPRTKPSRSVGLCLSLKSATSARRTPAAGHDTLSGKRESWMSKRALEFVETWVSEQIYPEGLPPKVDVSGAKALAANCRAANAAGISDAEIGEQFDN